METSIDLYRARLGRKPMLWDNRHYRLANFITPDIARRAAAISAKEWSMGTILDQGNTPHCVGFAWAGWGICEPIIDAFTNADGNRIYYEAKVIDGEPNQEDGSTTLSGVKAMQQDARLKNYAFATTLDDIVTWVLAQGPVVVGTNWYEQMFTPDATGLVTIGGTVAGGHEHLIVGVDKNAQRFKHANSWGTSWSVGGFFYLSFTDEQRLQNENGDACTAVELPLGPAPAPTPGGCGKLFNDWLPPIITRQLK
jgi:hypothetical protein